MKNIGDRVRAERETQGISRSDLARAAGLSQTTLSDLELGYSKSTTALHKIATRLGVSPSWLETGKGPKAPREADPENDWIDVVVFAQSAALGDETLPDEYAESYKVKFKASDLKRKGLLASKLVVCYGSGDSMEPRIRDGDTILVDTSDTSPRDDEIFVVNLDGHLVAKRLQKLGTEWFLTSDNRSAPRWRLPVPVSFDTCPIVGRVHWIGSWED